MAATYNENVVITTAEAQITGFGSDMGVDLIIKASTGLTITVPTGATVQLTWTDQNGAQKVSQVLAQGTITDAGRNLGTYYPSGHVFASQAEVDSFMGTVTAKIWGVTMP